MCDACPDITVHDGELVWSCRLEEKLKYGDFVRGVRKEVVQAAAVSSALAGPHDDAPNP
jgi:hypothetical protein